MTVREWVRRYGELPTETLQTEVRRAAIKSEIPGYCYRRAGWVKYREQRGLVYLRCPRAQLLRALHTPAGPHRDEPGGLPDLVDPRDRPLSTESGHQGSGGAA